MSMAAETCVLSLILALKVKGQGQMSPKFNHFCGLSWHIHTKLHHFLCSNYSVFARTHT